MTRLLYFLVGVLVGYYVGKAAIMVILIIAVCVLLLHCGWWLKTHAERLQAKSGNPIA